MLNKVRNKIILLSLTMFLIIATCGVVAYSVLSQSLNANTQIIITDSGQAKSYIKISDYIGPSDNSSFSSLTSEPVFENVLEKTKDEDVKKGDFLRDVQFSYKNYYRYYLIKVEIQNLSDVNVNYSVSCVDQQSNPFVFSSQVELLYLKNNGADGNFNLGTTTPSGVLAPQETTTLYIALSVIDGQNLWELSSVKKQNFRLFVEVKV